VVGIVVFAVLWVKPLSAQNLLFYLPFDGELNAKVSAGDGTATYVAPSGKPDVKPTYADGIAGKALDIGAGFMAIYPTDKNFTDTCGTITFWAKRVGPKSPDTSYAYRLLWWTNKDGSWVTYIAGWETEM